MPAIIPHSDRSIFCCRCLRENDHSSYRVDLKEFQSEASSRKQIIEPTPLASSSRCAIAVHSLRQDLKVDGSFDEAAKALGLEFMV